MLGRENLLSREEVTRLQDLRGSYGIKAPAPICADERRRGGPTSCQVVQAPGRRRATARAGARRSRRPQADGDGEIRLTYRELSALIEDAIRSLR